MTLIGTVSYNIYCNFTNYGSALQTWALHQAINRLGASEGGELRWEAVLVDYCPDCLLDKDPRSPMKHMWDADEESRRLCELSLPAIRENAGKFDAFYSRRLKRTAGAYTSANYENVPQVEGIGAFVCGSDTIFCPDEFGGFDDGYYANYPCMQGRSVAYAASFGDPHFKDEDWPILDSRLSNFLALGLREDLMVPYVEAHAAVPVARVLDPTLLLDAGDYASISANRQEEEGYLLLYSRRHNPEMERYADELAARNGWKVVEISLRAENSARHRMFYEAGVEEFLALVRDASFVVTNSFHGAIFAYQFETPFYVFAREQANTKIGELLDLMGLSERMLSEAPGRDAEALSIKWAEPQRRVSGARSRSLSFLQMELELLRDAVGA